MHLIDLTAVMPKVSLDVAIRSIFRDNRRQKSFKEEQLLHPIAWERHATSLFGDFFSVFHLSKALIL
jgi:hypothetical protein